MLADLGALYRGVLMGPGFVQEPGVEQTFGVLFLEDEEGFGGAGRGGG